MKESLSSIPSKLEGTRTHLSENPVNQIGMDHWNGSGTMLRCSNRRGPNRLLLIEILPQFACELEQLLKKQGKQNLAAQVPTLAVLDRCRCEDGFCSSFYTQPKPKGAYGPGHESFDLDAQTGMVILDVVSGVIAHVEILNRDDIRKPLLAALP